MHHLLLSNYQLWVAIIGAIVPTVTYVLNHFAPWVKEPIKAFVLVVVTAVSSGLYTALATPDFGFNIQTLQLIVTAVFAALVAHHYFWKPSTISTLLGGGSNHQDHS